MKKRQGKKDQKNKKQNRELKMLNACRLGGENNQQDKVKMKL